MRAFYPVESGGLSKVADTPPPLIFWMWSGCMVVGFWLRAGKHQNNTLWCTQKDRVDLHVRRNICSTVVFISAVITEHTWSNIYPKVLDTNSCHSCCRSMSITSAPCLQRRWHSPDWTTTSGRDFSPTCARNSGTSRRSRSCTIRRTKSTWELPKLFLRRWKPPRWRCSRSTKRL